MDSIRQNSLQDMQKDERGYAWHFSFCLTMSQHQNVGHIMNNTRLQYAAARIISYATIIAKKKDLEIKVFGLIAGELMRGSTPLKYLSHKEIRRWGRRWWRRRRGATARCHR
jgi:hypothetical protein